MANDSSRTSDMLPLPEPDGTASNDAHAPAHVADGSGAADASPAAPLGLPHAAPSALVPAAPPGARPDGWALRQNEGADQCMRCGTCPRLLHVGRRRGPRGWTDIPGQRLCLRCFAARMAERRAPERMGESDGRSGSPAA